MPYLFFNTEKTAKQKMTRSRSVTVAVFSAATAAVLFVAASAQSGGVGGVGGIRFASAACTLLADYYFTGTLGASSTLFTKEQGVILNGCAGGSNRVVIHMTRGPTDAAADKALPFLVSFTNNNLEGLTDNEFRGLCVLGINPLSAPAIVAGNAPAYITIADNVFAKRSSIYINGLLLPNSVVAITGNSVHATSRAPLVGYSATAVSLGYNDANIKFNNGIGISANYISDGTKITISDNVIASDNDGSTMPSGMILVGSTESNPTNANARCTRALRCSSRKMQ